MYGWFRRPHTLLLTPGMQLWRRIRQQRRERAGQDSDQLAVELGALQALPTCLGHLGEKLVEAEGRFLCVAVLPQTEHNQQLIPGKMPGQAGLDDTTACHQTHLPTLPNNASAFKVCTRLNSG